MISFKILGCGGKVEFCLTCLFCKCTVSQPFWHGTTQYVEKKSYFVLPSLLQQLRPVNLAKKLRRRKELRAKRQAVNWATRWRRRQLWWQRQHIAWQSYVRAEPTRGAPQLCSAMLCVCVCGKSERTLHDYRCHWHILPPSTTTKVVLTRVLNKQPENLKYSNILQIRPNN